MTPTPGGVSRTSGLHRSSATWRRGAMTHTSRPRFFPTLISITALLALPALLFAQEATMTGTVTDSTGGVLPGVTITAVHEATGNTFVAVTDSRGAFRLPVRTGTIRVSAELP